MPTDPLGLLVLFASVGVTFFVSRRLSAGWRKRRQERAQAQAQAQARAGESRQARRARERKGVK